MVRIVTLFFLVFLLSCSPAKNEFGQERFRASRFTIKPVENAEFYKRVDTSAVYVLTSIYNNGNFVINIAHCLKFYKDGRVGDFSNYNLDKKEFLNPKKAEMGYYKFENDKLEIEFMSHSAQAGNFLAKEKVSIKGDRIVSFDGEFRYEYVKKKLPEDYLIYRPDW